LKKTDI